MSKALEGMARAFDTTSLDYHGQEPSEWVDQADVAGMKAALLWLAANVSDEMVEAALTAKRGLQVNHHATDQRVYLAKQISAALRAAAEGK